MPSDLVQKDLRDMYTSPFDLPPLSSSLTKSHSLALSSLSVFCNLRFLHMAFSLSEIVCTSPSNSYSLSNPNIRLNSEWLSLTTFPHGLQPSHTNMGVSCYELTILSAYHCLESELLGMVTEFVVFVTISMAYLRPAFTGIGQVKCIGARVFPFFPSLFCKKGFWHCRLTFFFLSPLLFKEGSAIARPAPWGFCDIEFWDKWWVP